MHCNLNDNNVVEQSSSSHFVRFSYFYVVLIIILIGLCLRLYQLNQESLWLDEGISVQIARTEDTLQIVKPSWQEFNPPFYYLVLHYWINVFGDSEFSVRFPSLLFSFGCMFMLYQIAILLFDKKTALLSVLLLSLSGYHVAFAQEARGYSLMAMETFCSMYFLIQMVKGSKWRHRVGYIVSSSLLLYTHPYGIFIIVSQNLYMIFRSILRIRNVWLGWKQWILLQLVLLVSFLPWIGDFISKSVRIQSSGLLWEPSIFDVPGALKTFSGDSAYVGVFFILLATFAIVRWKGGLAWPVNNVTSVKEVKWYRNYEIAELEQICFLLMWLWVPIILPFIISKVSTPIFHSRYVIAASGAFYILVSRGIVCLNRKWVTVVSLLVILGLYPLEVIRSYTTVNKEPWREVVAAIEDEAEAGDAVVGNANYCLRVMYNYYAVRSDLETIPFPAMGKKISEEDILAFNPVKEKHDRIWLILSHRSDEIDLLKEDILLTHQLVKHKEYYRVEVFCYEKK